MRRNTIARLTAAILGSLGLAISAIVCIARAAPFSLGTRFAMAHYSFVLIWITAACFGFVAKSGARAWAVYIALSALFLALALWSPS
ncbi:hypothetical protein LVJ94_02105 [Pendulispora rubella]|uniref:Uncharacterized protein n=1 Tax=Pendulispora rubella TaxID=2741070 RepID=A0ABZ2L7Z2_9BACT